MKVRVSVDEDGDSAPLLDVVTRHCRRCSWYVVFAIDDASEAAVRNARGWADGALDRHELERHRQPPR